MTAATLRSDKPAAILETSTAPRYGEPCSPTARAIGRVLRRAPVGVGLVVLLWGFGLASGKLRGATPGWRDAVGIGLPALLEGRWWTVLSSLLWCAGPGGQDVRTALNKARRAGVVAEFVTFNEEEGAAFVSLSGAPLARLDRGEQTGAVDRLLDLSSRALAPAYGFRSLLAFKAKFQPDNRPLYMSYPDATALPAIGTALTRAYLPDAGTARVATLIRWLCWRGS